MCVSRTVLGHHKNTVATRTVWMSMVCVSKTCFSLLRYCEKVALRIIITPALASALLQTLANQGIVGLAPKACVPYIELVTKVLAPREIRTNPPQSYIPYIWAF